MTQEVQPLTWQKRTNIEEHQQFFSKINEIIDNLAPTVEEAEAAIAQATAAIASANDAIATANAASAAASAAASQAQTAASTVAGYDSRLTAAEDSIDTQGQQITVLQGRTGALEVGMTNMGTRMTAAESKNSQQDTDIAALQNADGQNVKLTGTNAIGNYAVLLTGNQTKAGVLTLGTANGLIMNTPSGYNILGIKAKGSAVGVDLKDTSNDVNDAAADRRLISLRHFYSGQNYDTYWLEFLPRNNIVDKDTTTASGGIEFVIGANNEMTISLFAYNDSGSVVRKQLARFANGVWN